MAKVIIFGVGQMAEVAHYYLTDDSPHEVVAFTVDSGYIKEPQHFGLPVVPFEDVERVYPPGDYRMFLPISYRGVNQVRSAKYASARDKGYSLISYVSSKATVWTGLAVGDNCFIFENNVIQPFVEIGNDVILWSGNHIGHHTTIGDHCFVASHAVISGNVTIEPHCFVGVNATIRDGVTIGRASVIGAGALILRSAAPESVFMGAATRPTPMRSSELENI
jgi:sugar O-acyltransferase (sialic acid O-acetyltransferase NeuD family)